MKTNIIKTFAALSAAALLSASASAIVIDISSVPSDSGIQFNGNSTFEFFGNNDGYVFQVDDSDGGAGDSIGLFGAISGIWTIDPWSGKTTTLSGAPGSMQIWDNNADVFSAELNLQRLGTILNGGVIGGLSNLSNFAYTGTNMDLMELYAAGSARLSLSFEVARGPSNLSIDYIANNSVESSFSGDIATPIPDGGTTAAMLGFGLLAFAAVARRKSWKKAT